MTTSPRSSAGRTTVATWCARSAAYRSASARGAMSPRWCSTMSRIRTPTSVPPGSRVRTTVRPASASHSSAAPPASSCPTPSPPSNVTKRPLTPSLLAPRASSRAPSSWPCCRVWRACASARRALGALVGEQLDGALEVDLLDGLAARDGRVRLAVGDVRAEPAVLDLDRLAADRVVVELLERAGRAARAVLRLGVELERLVEVDVEDRRPRSAACGSRRPSSGTGRSGRSAR